MFKSMKKIMIACMVLTLSSFAMARGGSHSVRSYTRHDGTYVQSHRATDRNGTKYDNWSTKGNVNPYTGKAGTKNP